MRIQKLTPAVAENFFSRRSSHDASAESVAAGIVADVRKKRDAALFRWAKQLDGLTLTSRNLWITRAEIRASRR